MAVLPKGTARAAAERALKSCVPWPLIGFMALAPLAAYVLGAMTAWVPLEEHAWVERREITSTRYEEIAETIAMLALEEPPVFDGEEREARARTALLLASIASYESHFAARVDDCRVSRGGAFGLWQTVVPRARVCRDRREAARVALAMVRQSFTECRAENVLDRLGFYTDGFCRPSWGRSRFRIGRAEHYWKKNPIAVETEADDPIERASYVGTFVEIAFIRPREVLRR